MFRLGLGFRFSGFLGFGFKIKVQCSGFRVQGSMSRVEGLGFGAQGVGFTV
jgi:hypothetical protein